MSTYLSMLYIGMTLSSLTWTKNQLIYSHPEMRLSFASSRTLLEYKSFLLQKGLNSFMTEGPITYKPVY